MPHSTPLETSQLVARICLFMIGAIAVTGGCLQMYLGQPDTTPRLDNVHRFMAGVYLATGFIAIWTGIAIREQSTLVYLIALGVLLAAVGRLVSISQVGLPTPHAVWIGYLVPELVLPVILAWAQYRSS
ncbi:DUF4345 domain-containing protein [Variovorax sp. KK3]|uniref:DUF4345 domain-containing protein n=1 Tax=Variovorax sp. KK3 TaxID=1855728 RepID=UPI00097C4E8D|nr:DUF4345 domain-containing protein [Variovorax sp. KK3]